MYMAKEVSDVLYTKIRTRYIIFKKFLAQEVRQKSDISERTVTKSAPDLKMLSKNSLINLLRKFKLRLYS